MPARAAALRKAAFPPPAFRLRRGLPVGNHPILEAFPGLDKLGLAQSLEPDPETRRRLFAETTVEIVDDDVWMYVSPWRKPRGTRGWSPVLSPGRDCIVIGRGHLSKSDALFVFLDIFHELCHVRQRHAGAELFDRSVSYVRRWTEVEAYRFVVDAARHAGISDEVLRDYLRVEWISEEEFRELLATLSVSSA